MLKDGRWGLLMNQASVDAEFRYASDVLRRRFPGQLAAIFSPQHGLWCEEQANMIESGHGRLRRWNLPLYSLYSATRSPTAEMLDGLDAFVVDLQDVGTRVYTFVWTVSYCLEACARRRIPVIVLDRPNPIGGEICEGPLLNVDFRSFVGRHTIPMRHGLTLGELALLLNDEMSFGCTVEVVCMDGWRRHMYFPDTGRAWVAPSPNMPKFETALFYPGQVLWEGTRISEGRGTTMPFEVVGAPFVDPDELVEECGRYGVESVHLRPVRFRPTFDKWQGEICGGLMLHPRDPRGVRSYHATLAIMAALRRLYPEQFAWLPPPYEYEHTLMPIDIISGGDAVRQAIDANATSPNEIRALAALDEAAWQRRAGRYWLYE
jgi:uncharacterized protein YbbC (DUF1343 family)